MIVKGGFVHVAFALIKRITIEIRKNIRDVSYKYLLRETVVLKQKK